MNNVECSWVPKQSASPRAFQTKNGIVRWWNLDKSSKSTDVRLRESPAPLNIPTPTPAPLLRIGSNLENPGLGPEGVWGSILDENLLLYSFQKVGTYILIDFALVGDGFYFPNDERRFT